VVERPGVSDSKLSRGWRIGKRHDPSRLALRAPSAFFNTRLATENFTQ
jgi:hypothetical protein